MSDLEDDRGAETPLAALPRELPPPAELEERVVARLAARGLVTRRRALRWMAPLAAALAGVAGGWLLRGSDAAVAPAPDAGGALYLLLIEGEPAEAPPVSELVASYKAWGEGLAASGQLAGAEKLKDEGIVLAAGASGPASRLEIGPSTLGGFFLVRAGSLAEAEAIARTSPHVRWGGRVTVRPVDPV
jgi:hypothetical protein